MNIDLGCGTQKQEGFTGVDCKKFNGVDIVHDLRTVPWPFESDSADKVYCSHFVEHLTGEERVSFFNELFRIMKKGSQATIIAPHWSNDRAYGDPTHKWPPISGWTFLYLNKEWRSSQAPHVDYICDFDWAVAGGWDEWLQTRNAEFKSFAMQRYINSYRDIIVTLTKR